MTRRQGAYIVTHRVRLRKKDKAVLGFSRVTDDPKPKIKNHRQ